MEYHNIDRGAVAARLKAARAVVFPTAADAARALGMKPVTVRAHESGQNGIDVFDLERYARRYGVDIGWLLKGGDDPKPRAEYHVEWGERIPVWGLIQDGAWLPDDVESDEWPILQVKPPTHGGEEFTTYADPRFPLELVSAYRVASTVADGPYVDGSIIFTVPNHIIGYKNGDHLVIVIDDRHRGIVQWTLRRVMQDVKTGKTIFESLISDGPPLERLYGEEDVFTMVQGVVIGSVQRRAVNELDIGERAHIEGFGRRGTAEGPKKPNWMEIQVRNAEDMQKMIDAVYAEKVAEDAEAAGTRKPKRKRP